jgi:hypothetical protein
LNVGVLGAKRKLSLQDVQLVGKAVTNEAINLLASNTDKVHEDFQKRIALNKGFNSMASLKKFAPLSTKTSNKYLTEVNGAVRIGKVKPMSRLEPYLNIRNPISKAAGLLAIYDITGSLEHIHSDDEVSFMIF